MPRGPVAKVRDAECGRRRQTMSARSERYRLEISGDRGRVKDCEARGNAERKNIAPYLARGFLDPLESGIRTACLE